jgi:putative DNA primase/helicase
MMDLNDRAVATGDVGDPRKGARPMNGAAAAKARRSETVLCMGMHLTDVGNGERLAARCRDRIRYCPPRKKWLTWDGRRWKWDDTGEVIRLAKKTARAIYGEAAHAKDKDEAQAIAKHAHNSEKAERIKAMMMLAQSEPGIAVMPTELDADPWAFNCANGTLDLRTGELRAHQRSDLITKIADTEFHADATSLLWDSYLETATGGDAELAAYLQRAVGYALQGSVSERAFFFVFGPPAGTKSTFLDAVACTLGEYATPAAFTTWLVQTSTGGNRGDLVSLMGARLVTSVEVRKGARFDEEIIKRVTGGDEITAAAKYEAELTFRPSFALWLAANDPPTIRDDDEGMWARVRRIPFTNPLPKDQQDPTMREKLRDAAVRSAVLAWAVKGCLRWRADGLGTCDAIERSNAAYRVEMDRVAGFFAERCKFGAGEKEETKTLRMAYDDWCREQGIKHPLGGKDFADKLQKHGCEKGKTDGKRIWKGVRLLGDWEEPETGTPGTPGHGFPKNLFHENRAKTFSGNACPADPADPAEAGADPRAPHPGTGGRP